MKKLKPVTEKVKALGQKNKRSSSSAWKEREKENRESFCDIHCPNFRWWEGSSLRLLV